MRFRNSSNLGSDDDRPKGSWVKEWPEASNDDKIFLETPTKMMNDQVITMLIWTVPEPLLNAIDFHSSLAERIIFLYNLRYFLTMLF